MLKPHENESIVVSASLTKGFPQSYASVSSGASIFAILALALAVCGRVAPQPAGHMTLTLRQDQASLSFSHTSTLRL